MSNTKLGTSIDDAMARHSRVALQFSGGKDSLACLYLMRPYWPQIALLWANPGDEFPETREVVNSVRNLVGGFHEIRGNVQDDINANGYPADMVPTSATKLGRIVEPSESTLLLRSRFECCWENMWLPMRNAVMQLGITLLIHGHRESERMRAPIYNGFVDSNGIEYLLPINDWSRSDVLTYLDAEGVPLPRQYAYGLPSLDCMHCTGYLAENANMLDYLRKFHPKPAIEVERRYRLIKSAQDADGHLMLIALGERQPLGSEGQAD